METSTASRRLRAAVPAAASSALTLALCAAFSPAAEGALVLIDYTPDVLLGTFHMDIDGDSTDEYYWSRTDTRFGPSGFENVVDTLINSVVGHVSTGPIKPGTYADRLNAGDVVDGSRTFVSDPAVILSGQTTTFKDDPTPYGNFFGVDNGYVGLRFELADGTHYGFVQMHDPPGDFFIARLGYEDIPDAAVTIPRGQVPEPGTLALLVAGAAGVLALRRRQRGS